MMEQTPETLYADGDVHRFLPWNTSVGHDLRTKPDWAAFITSSIPALDIRI